MPIPPFFSGFPPVDSIPRTPQRINAVVYWPSFWLPPAAARKGPRSQYNNRSAVIIPHAPHPLLSTKWQRFCLKNRAAGTGPAAVSGCFRPAGRFLCSASASLPRHGAGGTLGRRPYRVTSGRLAASFAVPPLPQASHVMGPAARWAGSRIGLLPVGWPLPLLHLCFRKPPMSRGRRGPAAVSGCFRSAGRFLCSTSAAASLPRHGASGTLVRRKTCAL